MSIIPLDLETGGVSLPPAHMPAPSAHDWQETVVKGLVDRRRLALSTTQRITLAQTVGLRRP